MTCLICLPIVRTEHIFRLIFIYWTFCKYSQWFFYFQNVIFSLIHHYIDWYFESVIPVRKNSSKWVKLLTAIRWSDIFTRAYVGEGTVSYPEITCSWYGGNYRDLNYEGFTWYCRIGIRVYGRVVYYGIIWPLGILKIFWIFWAVRQMVPLDTPIGGRRF